MGQYLNRLFRSQEEQRRTHARVPWRNTSGWTKEIRDELKTNIATRFPPKNGQEIPYIKIALTGQIGAGKSSYINSLNSIFQEEVVGARADVGLRAVSLTEEYHMYKIIPKDESEPLRWRICDTMGLQPHRENDCANILKAIDGHVPDRFKFSEEQINQGTPGYIAHPELKDKAHCVAIVINAQGLEQMDDDVKQKLKTLRRELGAPRTYILLTHIDEACEKVAENVTNVYHSTAIHDLVSKVGNMLDGLPENHIFPVMNYKKQVELEDAIDILLLWPLRQMLCNAQDYLKDQMANLSRHDSATAISQRGQPVMQASTV